MALFCYGRLGSKPVFSTLARLPSLANSQQYAVAAGSVPKITFKKSEPEKNELYELKNKRLHRPLSPHLTIYAVQLTSTLSITHRAAGLVLTGYASALGIGALMLPNDLSHYITMIEGLNLAPATLFVLKALIASPLGYHLANGLRHLYWDTARGLAIKEVYKTGYAMLGAATVITLLLASL